MKYLRFGLISCLLLSAAACDRQTTDVGAYADSYYTYTNKLEIPVLLEYHYSDADRKTGSRAVTLEPGKSLEENSGYYKYALPVIMRACDSVRFVFDKNRELWYFSAKEPDKPGNVFEIKNYESTDDVHFRYDIDQSVYDRASDI